MGSRKGIGVTANKSIEYCFTDSVVMKEPSYYKVVHLSAGHTFLCSEKISTDPSETYIMDDRKPSKIILLGNKYSAAHIVF